MRKEARASFGEWEDNRTWPLTLRFGITEHFLMEITKIQNQRNKLAPELLSMSKIFQYKLNVFHGGVFFSCNQ